MKSGIHEQYAQQSVFPGVQVEVIVPGMASAQTSLFVKVHSWYREGILAIINPYCSSKSPSIATARQHILAKRSTTVPWNRKSCIVEVCSAL